MAVRGSSKAAVSASAPKKGSGGKGKLRSVRIEVAEGGYTARCDYDPAPSKAGNSAIQMYQPEPEYVFTDRKALDTFLDEKLGTPKGEKD